jgi:hypothetical protein
MSPKKEVTYKQCFKCRRALPISYYYWRPETKKYRGVCIVCSKGYSAPRVEKRQKLIGHTKDCGKCGERKHIGQFHKDKYTPTGYTSWCKDCKRHYFTVNAKQVRINRIANVYKVSKTKATELYEEKHCAICSVEMGGNGSSALHVDHCHTTGKVRGAICSACNRGIGIFNDNIKVMAVAIEYLKKHQPHV